MKTYAELQQHLKTLCKHNEVQSDDGYLDFYNAVKGMAKSFRNNSDRIGEFYAAIETSDRGVVLATFKVQFALDNKDGVETGKMLIKVGFVEDTDMFRCPRAVSRHITDEKAKDYLAKVEQVFPRAEEETLSQQVKARLNGSAK